MLGRAALAAAEGPYQAAVPPFIATARPVLSPETATLSEAAAAEMARFDAQTATSPVPMPAVLLQSESASSSQIENLTSSPRQIALSVLGTGSKRNAELIAGNVAAMEAALSIDEVSPEGILAVLTTVPISAGLLADTGDYFQALEDNRSGDVDSLVRQLAGSAMLAVAHGRSLLTDINDLRARQATRAGLRPGSTPARLADELFAQPVINAQYVVDRLGVSYATALAAARTLESAGIVKPMTAARRNQIWEAPAVLNLLAAFAARTTRRSQPQSDPSTGPER
ncbi:MAG: hypothetical protein LBH68_01250 [Bifidobacteriaceae bacterium]|nr:hypothetical protein [Bifidobacteriaceae bacterium]